MDGDQPKPNDKLSVLNCIVSEHEIIILFSNDIEIRRKNIGIRLKFYDPFVTLTCIRQSLYSVYNFHATRTDLQ